MSYCIEMLNRFNLPATEACTKALVKIMDNYALDFETEFGRKLSEREYEGVLYCVYTAWHEGASTKRSSMKDSLDRMSF